MKECRLILKALVRGWQEFRQMLKALIEGWSGLLFFVCVMVIAFIVEAR